ncbi:hypothetical protein O987_16675 [Comamonas testosteroni TK102]|uniref:Capsule polysaccharide biosynthesis protein n=1 Tax=Comamonas testosteroni TK102 TaxID=1392005 RepID=A0A076PKS2_COMTE|nr:hypothetical protein [Comamonas testosteroni]AIJ47449.1 hypothetical protein O987_16675 [Comamonas testosteroni TK102]
MKFFLKNNYFSNHKKTINDLESYFSRKKLFNLFKRKKFKYDYELINPEKIFGDLSKRIKCFLVGDSWENSVSAEVIAFVGFNDWKWGFVSKYFEGSKAIFFKRKASSYEIYQSIQNFPVPVKKIVVWGYNDPRFFSFFIKKMKLNVLRMEDGFLRSFDLGASHATPYSLIVDGVGLYFDPRSESEIERLLNSYEFTKKNIDDSRECLKLLHDLKLSKYNSQGIIQRDEVDYKFSRRVAVIGQVDGDQSIRLGNINRWSIEQLIKLAKFENPDAEIIYRPHPDVYNGFQKSILKKRRVAKYCTIVSPTSNQIEFLNSVDHVYTITSLSGLEALLLGKKVTVVGQPFYAGWGLTDDRVEVPRRNRSLKLEELFYAIYLKYPRYLANINEAKEGFIATCYKIAAERECAFYKKIAVSDFEIFDAKQKSIFWPKFVLGANKSPIGINGIDFSQYFSMKKSEIYKKSVFLAILGKANKDEDRDAFILKYRLVLSLSDFGDVLSLVSKYFPGEYLRKHFSWLLNECGELEYLDYLSKSRFTVEKIGDIQEEGRNFESAAMADSEKINLYGLFLVFFDNKNYHDALLISEKLLLNGYSGYSFLIKLGNLSEMLFDAESALAFSKLCKQIDLFGDNRKALLLEFKNLPLEEGLIDEIELIKSIFLSIDLNPERISAFAVLLKKYGLSEKYINIIKSSIFLDNEKTVKKSQAYLEVGSYDLALRVAKNVIVSGDLSDKANIAYAKALFALGESEESLRILRVAKDLKCSDLVCRELVRQLVHVGDFGEALAVIAEAKYRGMAISETISIPVYLGLGQIEKGYSQYLKSSFRNDLINYFKDKYFVDEELDCENLLIMAVYGPGDEIRFASLYSDFERDDSINSLQITCDYRLEKILSRSFPNLKFLPVRRNREFSKNYPMKLYNELPGSELCVVLDNSALPHIDRAEKIVCVTDLISRYRKSYSCFPGRAYLISDDVVTASFKNRLPKGELLVGISWRSSLQNFSRNEHYLSVEDLMPLFEVEGVRFVNLQYDDCRAELEKIERYFPGKLINFSELDQFNDLDSVASLMSSLDLVISPATTVVELAGALGCETWMISNSAELKWRKIDANKTDVWHNSVRHIESDNLGDKLGLVRNLAQSLELFARENLISKEVIYA